MFFEKAVDLYKDLPDELVLYSRCLHNQAASETDLGNYKRSYDLFQKMPGSGGGRCKEKGSHHPSGKLHEVRNLL